MSHIDEPGWLVRTRLSTYFLTALSLIVVCWLLRDVTWQSTATFHTIMEVVSIVLALIVGTLALVIYYGNDNRVLLLIGAGFVGTGLLDGYHTIVTSAVAAPLLPADLLALSPWSWAASRLFLSLLLCFSWLEQELDSRSARRLVISETHVYVLVACLASFSLVLFSFMPLPRAYSPDNILGRPEEIIPATFFAIALYGYLIKGAWRTDPFEHWLILALIVSVASQLLFMPLSFSLFDLSFDMAHLLKNVTYILVLVGLLFSFSAAFTQAKDSTNNMAKSLIQLQETNVNLERVTAQHKRAEAQALHSENSMRTIFEIVPDGLITIDELGSILTVNPGAEKMFGHMSTDMVGKNVSMLMPPRVADKHDGYLESFRGGNEVGAVGDRRDQFGLRKNGKLFALELTISKSRGATGQKITLGVLRDVTEEKETANNLARFVVDLEATNKELEQFAYIASHDLKAPLRGIDNLAGFIRDDIADILDDATLKNFDLMQNRIHRMEQLLEDLLTYSRAGRRNGSVEEINLEDLLKDVMEMTSVPDGFTVKVLGELITLQTARAPLQQVLMNIIGNSIKHHDQDTGNITVDVKQAENLVQISITDDGPGIAPEFHERIFKMFHTLKPRDELEGSGMGLAIVKKVVESAGGGIEVQSVENKRGTKFLIEWPKNQREEAA